MKKILLLGSGELGKEFVISAQRKGQYIIACDSYAGAPAMQVADECEVFSMLDGEAPAGHYRTRNRGYPYGTPVRFRERGYSGCAQRACGQLYNEP